MSDTITILKEKLDKANAKVFRYDKALKAAEKERSDIHTTLRVLSELNGESEDKPSGESGALVSQRQHNILQIMPVGPEKAKSPSELHSTYTVIFGEISIDVFRTTIWRMAKASHVSSDNGKYWLETLASPDDDSRMGELPEGLNSKVWSMPEPSQGNTGNWDWKDDTEVPF